MTQRELGVMDHFSIGGISVPDTYKVLTAGNRLEGSRHDEAPKIGLDGKYQFNMYDPDGIRSGAHELPRHREALLLAVYCRRPGGMRQSSGSASRRVSRVAELARQTETARRNQG